MEDQKISKEQELQDVVIEGLTEKEAEEVKKILKRFIKAYQESGEDQETFEWLEKQLHEEMPEKSAEEIKNIKKEIIDSIKEYDKNLKDLTQSVEKGSTKEKWFADRMEEAAKGVAVNDYGNYLNQIDTVLENANRQMQNKVLRLDGGVKECLNLDGFIAEQYLVNNFNAKAALRKSDLYAEIPKEGQPFGKNSFDVVIKNRKEPGIVHQYQFKFGKDTKATIQLLKSGNYNNQRYVVPSEQVKDVQSAFPNKSVTDHIGGTDKVDICSDSLTKEAAKKFQAEVQDTGEIPRTDWNVYNTKELAVNLGKQAGFAGMQAALITTGLDLAGKAMNGEEVDGGDVLETALKVGADSGVKAAAGGALTVASEKGILAVIPKGTAPGVIANIACIGIENIKIMMKVAKGDLTVSEALEQMGRTSASMVAGLSCTGVGAVKGAMLLGWIPVVGPIVGGLVGGMVGYAVGSKFGETIYNGARKVANTGKKIVKEAWEKVKDFGNSIKEGIRSLLPW